MDNEFNIFWKKQIKLISWFKNQKKYLQKKMVNSYGLMMGNQMLLLIVYKKIYLKEMDQKLL